MLKEKIDLKTLLMLVLIRDEGPIGRYRLDDMLNLPEGVVRGLLLSLSRRGYISTSKLGCKLTTEGESLLRRALAEYQITAIKEFETPGPLKIGDQNVAVQIENKAWLIKSPMEQRDIAVRAGAQGAVLITFSRGKLAIPNVYPILADKYPKLAERILHSFKLNSGDVIVIGGAENRWRALEGSLAIALSLAEQQKR